MAYIAILAFSRATERLVPYNQVCVDTRHCAEAIMASTMAKKKRWHFPRQPTSAAVLPERRHMQNVVDIAVII
jgi:hypothetical protein